MTIDQYEADVKRINDEHFETLMKDFDEMEKIAGQSEPEALHIDHINPNHYKDFFGVESIDLIERALKTEAYIGFLLGSYLKYAVRCGSKPGEPTERDVAKMQWYRNKYREFKEKNTP